MPDIETPDADALEQQQDLEDSSGIGRDTEVDIEASEADAVEQQTPLGATGSRDANANNWDVDEGDLAESSREVEFDDEDYR